MKMKALGFALALGLALPLGGCATAASLLGDTVAQVGTYTPSQAKTLAIAEKSAALATTAVDTAVKSGLIKDRAVLEQIRKLNDGVSAALHAWSSAADQNNSLLSATFNAALDAFNAYSTSKGVAPVAPATS